MVPAPFRVARRRRETARHVDARARAARRRDGRCRSRPGQFTMLYAFGVGEVPISVSGDPAGRPLVHTDPRRRRGHARALRGARRATCSACAARSAAAWPRRGGRGRRRRRRRRRASGSRRCARSSTTCSRDRERYGRVVAALRRAARPTSCSTASELERWRGRLDVEVEVTVDSADAGWRGRRRRRHRRSIAAAPLRSRRAPSRWSAGPR